VLGLLASNERHERVQTFRIRLAEFDARGFAAILDEHVRAEAAVLARRGFTPDAMRFAHALDMRYVRQAFELTVDLPDGAREAQQLRAVFLEAYARHFGRADAAAPIEIVNVRTTAIGVTPHPDLPPVRGAASRLQDALIARRTMVANGARVEAAIYERDRLPIDVMLEGPAIVEEDGATTVLPPGWRGRRDANGNLRLTRS